MLAFVGAHTEAGAAQLAGNSVHVDAAFLRRWMPRLAAHLHYRIVDVSTIMELCRRWYPRAYRRAPRKKVTPLTQPEPSSIIAALCKRFGGAKLHSRHLCVAHIVMACLPHAATYTLHACASEHGPASNWLGLRASGAAHGDVRHPRELGPAAVLQAGNLQAPALSLPVA